MTAAARRLHRRLATGAACLLIASGVLVIRSWAALRSWLGPHSLLLPLLFGSNPDSLFPGGFPSTFGAGLVILVIGILILTSTIMADGRPGPEPRPSLRFPTPADGVVLLLLPLLALGLFAFAQRKGFHNHWTMTLAFLGILLVAVGLVAVRENRLGLRLGFRLTRLETATLVLCSLAVLALYASALDSWKFSFIGDEWAFFWMGGFPSRPLWKVPWLEASGVYGQWPVFTSGWQLLFMTALGRTNFAWRLSMSVMMVLCLPPLYLVLRHILSGRCRTPRLAAAVGCAWFATSELIVDWARIGEPNAVFVPPLIFGLCLFLAARERQSKTLYLLAGLAGGLGSLLSSLSALLAIGVLASLLGIEMLTRVRSHREEWRSLLAPAAFLLAGFVLGSAPIMVEVGYWKELIAHNLASTEAKVNRHLLPLRTLQSLFAFLDYRAHSHFLWKNVVDPVTAFFTAAAFGMLRFLGWRRFLDLVVTALVAGFLAGGISQYYYPPQTRILVMMVPVSLLAATGFAGLTHRAPPRVAPVLAVLLVSLSGAYSVLKLQTWNPYSHFVEFPMHEIRRFEESTLGTLHALILPEEKRRLLEDVLLAYGYEGRAAFFDNTPAGMARLAALLRRRAAQTEVRSWEFENRGDIRALAEKSGARFGPLIRGRAPESPADRNRFLRGLFDATNP